ncbi:MAG: TIR domain-containing protein [Anaerolineales bacterium]|nr:TIR domain-containing protein [Anaerolineales bacterium]
MAHDVFISYSSNDKPIADAVCANLEGAGVRCWIAPRDIAPGEDWPTSISKAIAQSRVMVLVFSAFSNSSEDVGRELILATRSKLIIVPFKIENVEPEPGKDYILARTHWLDAINPPTREQIKTLVDCVKGFLSELPLPPPPPGPKKTTLMRYLRISIPLLVMIGLFLVGFVVFRTKLFGILSANDRMVVSSENAITETAATAVPATGAKAAVPTQAETNQTPPGVIFMDDFNDFDFIGSLDNDKWAYFPELAYTTIKQADGRMGFTKSSTAGSQVGKIKSVEVWSPGEFRYVEARLRAEYYNENGYGNVGVSLEKTDWYVGCGILVGEAQPFFFCNSASAPYNSFNYYERSSTNMDLNQWHTARIEMDPRSGEITFYKDGMYFGRYQPDNAAELIDSKFNVVIGIWTEETVTITGSVDDVVLGK